MSQLAKLVLENDLLLEFEKFKRGKKIDTAKIQALLHYYKPPHALNKEQQDFLAQNKVKIEQDELNAIVSSGCFDLPLEDLAKQTTFKIILSENKTDFPYVCVFNDRLENNFTATFKSREERTKAIRHFMDLFSGAKEIFIYDKFLKMQWLEYLIQNCIIRSNVKLIVVKTDNNEFKESCQVCGLAVTVVDGNNVSYHPKTTHDRYINIDNKIQIILTSGLQHLQKCPTNSKGKLISKDFTYILREI